MKKAQASEIVKIIEHAWPGPKISTETAVVMIMGVCDLPYELTHKTMTRLVQTNQFRPSIAEVRREVAKELGLLPPPVDIASLEAVRQVEQIEQWRFYNGSGWKPDPIDKVHPLVERVLRGIDTTNNDWLNRFQRAYAAALRDEIKTTLGRPLDGQMGLEDGK